MRHRPVMFNDAFDYEGGADVEGEDVAEEVEDARELKVDALLDEGRAHLRFLRR